MRIKKNFVMRDVCGEKVIIAEGIENIDFSKVICLNETAAFLWEKAKERDFTFESLAQQLFAEYDVSEQQALKDTEEVVGQWIKEGLIEE